ncbi:hypothetical protein Shyhy01_24300 [Streptomyces hygroscopicus subsp. hygroscopicus]|nr:hypothetical protein Shyhy01_24300 [Streptomyces hygroscopicus subsp. hygroscopicus]
MYVVGRRTGPLGEGAREGGFRPVVGLLPDGARTGGARPPFVNVGRVARPEEQAAAILFLASDAASDVNGAILPVDDGWSAV